MIRTILRPFREFGPGPGLLYVLNQMLVKGGFRTRLRLYELMIQPVADQPLGPEKRMKSFEIRRLEEDNPIVEQMPRPPHVIRSRFEQGAVCLGAFKNDQFVGYQWLSIGPYEEDEVRCTFVPVPEDKAAFDYDIYIFPQHRFGLGFLALWNSANKFMRERKIDYTCSRVSRFNIQSRQSHSHFRWKRRGMALFLTGPTRQLMFASVAPFVHLSMNRNRRPRIVIDTS